MHWNAVRPLLVGVPLALGIWFTVLLGMAFVEPPGQPLAVRAASGADGALGAVIAAGGSLLQVRGDTVIAIADTPGFVERLYRAGASLVLPARTAGCIVVTPTRGPLRSRPDPVA